MINGVYGPLTTMSAISQDLKDQLCGILSFILKMEEKYGPMKMRFGDTAVKSMKSWLKKTDFIGDQNAILCAAKDRIEGTNIFFVGKQDIDDSIPSSVWQSILTKRLPEVSITEGEIERVKKAIADNQSLQSGQKFYVRLKALLMVKAGEEQQN